MSEDGGGDEDKQFEPSQKKLTDARKKGEVPRSADLTTAAGYSGILVAATVVGPTTVIVSGSALMTLLSRSGDLSEDLFAGSGRPLGLHLLQTLGSAFAPWVMLPFALSLLMLLVQRGLIFAPSKLMPKLSRISLIKGFSNKFGRSGLFEFFKSFLKLSLYSVVLGIYFSIQLPRILGTMMLTPVQVAVEMGRLCIGLFALVLVIAFAIGGIDFLFQRADHLRKHRMSRKEMTDEQKQSEGDPMMKQQRRQRAVDFAMTQMLAEVPNADVVIVNPTHFAVALKWDRGSNRAPVCVAKGVDEIAARIRTSALENGVAIHRDPPTARSVYGSVKLGEQILPEHYRAVAAAIRFAEGLRTKAKGGSTL